LDDAVFTRLLNKIAEGKSPEERIQLRALARADATKALEEYTGLWKAWAEEERLRRLTIDLYSDVFSLKHQLGAEETVKPLEFVWGVGVSFWQLNFKGTTVAFEYPLLTQAVEIALDAQTLAIEIRPRAMDTRIELDAIIACQVTGAADVERTMREHLARHKEKPVTPYDPSSYTEILKLAAGNLDSQGSFREVLANGESIPVPGKHLVVTDGWVLLSRPRSNNYLFEDLKRLQAKL